MNPCLKTSAACNGTTSVSQSVMEQVVYHPWRTGNVVTQTIISSGMVPTLKMFVFIFLILLASK